MKRLFSGFPDQNSKKEKLNKIIENKKKWTISLLKDALGLFGLEKGGIRDELASRLIDYLFNPSILKSVTSATVKTKSNKSKGKGTKRKRNSKDTKTNKKKRAPSAYNLFTSSIRKEIKDENPEADFSTLARIFSDKWAALDDTTKEVNIYSIL